MVVVSIATDANLRATEIVNTNDRISIEIDDLSARSLKRKIHLANETDIERGKKVGKIHFLHFESNIEHTETETTLGHDNTRFHISLVFLFHICIR